MMLYACPFLFFPSTSTTSTLVDSTVDTYRAPNYNLGNRVAFRLSLSLVSPLFHHLSVLWWDSIQLVRIIISIRNRSGALHNMRYTTIPYMFTIIYVCVCVYSLFVGEREDPKKRDVFVNVCPPPSGSINIIIISLYISLPSIKST